MGIQTNTKYVNLILDSGAYSAWVRQSQINIDEYIDFCKQNNEYIDYIVNLDVIPGKWGQKASAEDLEASIQKGWDNYYYMLDKGILKNKLIHVFHQGEDFKWLTKASKEMGYIGISPGNDRTTQEKIEWLDQCMNYVTDKQGYPTVKFHGFGVTNVDILLRYPWYSVDSTSWALSSAFGNIYVPVIKNNLPLYNQTPWVVGVSSHSPQKRDIGKHFATYSVMEQNIIIKYIESKGFRIGKSEYKKENRQTYKLNKNECWLNKNDVFTSNSNFGLSDKKEIESIVEVIIERGVSNSYIDRDKMNIIYFSDLEKSFPPWPYSFKIKQNQETKGFGFK